jgi:apolipoprotein N-acyltransferase
LVPGLLAAFPHRTVPLFSAAVIVCNLVRAPVPQPPAGWIGVDTHFGGIAHGRVSPLAEFNASQSVQKTAASTDGKVVLFPETVVPTWTPSTDAFWQPTLDAVRAGGKTIIVGARLPIREIEGTPDSIADFSAALAVLQGAALPLRPVGTRSAEFQYDNEIVVRGSESAVLCQRIPVPIAMWKPFQQTGARLHLFSPGIISVAGHRAGVLICYEQLLAWPVMISMLHRPDVLLAVANDYWARGTPIPAHQRLAMISWSRLFDIPFLSATNL